MREVPTFNGWRGGRRKYDWHVIFNGRKWAIHKSQTTTVQAFQRLAHKRAAQRGLRIRTSIVGDEVIVQALRDEQCELHQPREVTTGQHQSPAKPHGDA